MAWKGKLGKRE